MCGVSLFRWELSGSPSACSVACGPGGTQTESYICMSAANIVVADSSCTTPKPAPRIINNCNSQSCAVPLSCSDGIQNGGETGVDCGGPTCAACSASNAPGNMAGYSGW